MKASTCCVINAELLESLQHAQVASLDLVTDCSAQMSPAMGGHCNDPFSYSLGRLPVKSPITFRIVRLILYCKCTVLDVRIHGYYRTTVLNCNCHLRWLWYRRASDEKNQLQPSTLFYLSLLLVTWLLAAHDGEGRRWLWKTCFLDGD